MLGYVVVLATGYVLGSKAGRRRYDQLAATYRSVTTSPAAKAVIDAGRRRLADRVSPDPPMVTVREVDDRTVVLGPETNRPGRRTS